jgi:hypothetical protein
MSEANNNLWYQSAGGTALYAEAPEASEYHYNDQAAYKSATGFDTNGKWEDPKFIDAANGDFHLRTDSPCIEAGIVIAGLVIDHDGIPLGRGTNPDIGAFETLKGGPRGL